jgi:ribosomal protein L16 Arg81 hydroxylase
MIDALLQAAQILDAWRAELAAEAVTVSFGSRAPNTAAMIDHYTVEIIDGGVTYSASAKHPHDAAALAKLKASDARELKARKAEKSAKSKGVGHDQ